MYISPRIALLWTLLATAVAWGSGTLPQSSAPSRVELRGTVTDTAGAPLVSVTVQVRAGERTLVATATDGDGGFRLQLPDALEEIAGERPMTLRAERLGYRTADLPFPDDPTREVHIVLAPTPLPLPGFQVDAGPVTCERDDMDGTARRLWERMAERHPGGLDTLGVATYIRVSTDTLNEPVERSLREDHEYEEGQRGSAPILRIGWTRRIERQGYAFPVRRTDRTGSFDSWSYAPIEADFAPHFGTDQFGRRHYLQMVSDGPDGWTVRFCARNEEDPHLVGRLEIGADTLLRRAEWRFHTPEPDEEAGGWASFPPPRPDGEAQPLLPRESMTWKTLPGDRTLRRAQWFESWILAPGDSVPFLPRRKAGASPEP